MRKIITAALAITLVAAAAQAQPRGGPPGGGGGPGPGGPPPAVQTALNQIVLTGVVLAIDPATERVTIAYQASEALGWPAGAMPFAMAKPGMLGDIQVKQTVRFTLDSHRIAQFLPVAAPGAEPGPGGPGGKGPPPGGPPPAR